jgi:hypothetical protein
VHYRGDGQVVFLVTGLSNPLVMYHNLFFHLPAEQQVPRLRFLVRCASEQTSLDSGYDFLQGKTQRAGPTPYVYCACIHLSDPVSLTAASEIKMCRGLPSAKPRCSVENRIGPAFL